MPVSVSVIPKSLLVYQGLNICRPIPMCGQRSGFFRCALTFTPCFEKKYNCQAIHYTIQRALISCPINNASLYSVRIIRPEHRARHAVARKQVWLLSVPPLAALSRVVPPVQISMIITNRKRNDLPLPSTSDLRWAKERR